MDQDLYDSLANHEEETTNLEASNLPGEQGAIKCVNRSIQANLQTAPGSLQLCASS